MAALAVEVAFPSGVLFMIIPIITLTIQHREIIPMTAMMIVFLDLGLRTVDPLLT